MGEIRRVFPFQADLWNNVAMFNTQGYCQFIQIYYESVVPIEMLCLIFKKQDTNQTYLTLS